jgi:hypothetical protein
MRLYPAKIPTICSELVSALVSGGDIETEEPKEVEIDIASVLNQYLETDRAVTERAKDMMQARNMPQGEFGRMKRLVADQKEFKIGDEMLDYVLDQIVEMLMHSKNVEEVYAEDVVMRRKMSPILKRHMAVDEEVDRETRAHIKHVQEGTSTWEVEYRRVMEEIKRRKGL